MRELTRIEYHYLWGDDNLPPGEKQLYDRPHDFARFLTDYNLAVNSKKHVDFIVGKRGLLPFTIVYREKLPQHIQDELDAYEATLAMPFVRSAYNNVVTLNRS